MDESIFGVETENLQPETPFEIMGLSAFSPCWKIETIPGTDLRENATIPGHQTHFSYHRLCCVPVEQVGECPEKYTSDTLELLILGEKTDKMKIAPITLLTSSISVAKTYPMDSMMRPEVVGFSLQSRMQWRLHHLQTVFPAMPSLRVPDVFTLYGTNDVDLVVFWSAQGSGSERRYGYHYVLGTNLGVQQAPLQPSKRNKNLGRALFAQTEREKAALLNNLLRNRHIREENPVKVIVQAPDTAEHDFSAQRSAVLPVSMVLKNQSWNKHVVVQLELLPSKDLPSQANHQPLLYSMDLGGSDFHWVGMTLLRETLAPGEMKTFHLHAIFLQPRVYDLNRWKMSVYGKEQKEGGMGGGGTGATQSIEVATTWESVPVGEPMFVYVPPMARYITLVQSNGEPMR